MEQWDGLGYYARACNLHALAKVVSRTLHGQLPDDPVQLQELPGVGKYTAGAVACFAYQKAVPAVDTNVRRVLSRGFGNAKFGMRDAELWGLGAALVSQKSAGGGEIKKAGMGSRAFWCPG